MPVTKFRDPKDARRALLASDIPIEQRLRDLYASWRSRWPVVQPRGVQRFRTIEASQESLDALRRKPKAEG